MTLARPLDVRLLATLVLALLVSAQAQAQAQASGYLPQRVWDARAGRFSDFETLAARASAAEVVFVGERHDDPATHRAQLALLEAIARRRGGVVLSLEMFERDVQPALDGYLAGRTAEAAALAASRPWPRYATDYRPMVELARERRWPVLAANVPRRIASRVARGGLSALDSLPAEERAFAAADVRCPRDAYRARFAKAMEGMGGHGAPQPDADAALERMYAAQCIKDETMAESIVRTLEAAPAGTLVVHLNGGFHSDFRQGVVDRMLRRRRGARVVTVQVVPVADLDAVDVREHRRRADFVVFVPAPPAGPAPS